jgi:hypothetical protein
LASFGDDDGALLLLRPSSFLNDANSIAVRTSASPPASCCGMSGVSAVGDGGGEDEAPGGGIMGDECYYQIQTHACFFVY